MDNHSDIYWMRRALRLATLGKHASPNPMVGCVIVNSAGDRVGEGFHPEPGKPHAEIFALTEAGEDAAGSTVYVTLEPCSHYGRTPPCVDALIAARVRRVVVATVDPDIRVSGRGIDKLRANGIDTDVGILEAEARQLNHAYIYHRTHKLPWVTVKVATTLDGKIATASGDSQWITGPITRKWVHRQLRDRTDAILVGITTVLNDDPELTTRLSNSKGRNPLRVIVDSRLRTPLHSRVVEQSEHDGKTVVACLEEFALERGQQYQNRGVLVLPFEPDNNNRIDLRQLLTWLGTSRGLDTVLVEGGSSVIASLLEQRLVNRYITTIGPKLIGGKSAIGPIGGFGLASTMKEAVRVVRWKARRSAIDLVIDAILSE